MPDTLNRPGGNLDSWKTIIEASSTHALGAYREPSVVIIDKESHEKLRTLVLRYLEDMISNRSYETSAIYFLANALAQKGGKIDLVGLQEAFRVFLSDISNGTNSLEGVSLFDLLQDASNQLMNDLRVE